MGSPYAKSKGPTPRELKALEPIPNDNTFRLQRWHEGEPHESWWLNQDRAAFSARAKQEAPRIIHSSMARRISKAE